MSFRRANNSGFHQGLALAPCLIKGILVLAALVIALVSSRAAKSKVGFKLPTWLVVSLKPIFLFTLFLGSRRLEGLRFELAAILDLREVWNRS